MAEELNEIPQLDEFVIATVRKIMPYGAFCTLDEYNNREEFIHISEVASRWVKNIHEVLKNGQKVVARVHRLTPEKNQIDLSLRRVSEADKKLKMEDYQKDKRAAKLFELCAKKMKVEHDAALATVGAELLKNHADLYSALEDISFNGEAAFKEAKVSPEWRKMLTAVAQQNIVRPEVVIAGTLLVRSYAPDAIDHIREALLSAKGAEKAGAEISLRYLGAPRYQLLVKAGEYKAAEKVLEKVIDEVSVKMKGIGTVEFQREAT